MALLVHSLKRFQERLGYRKKNLTPGKGIVLASTMLACLAAVMLVTVDTTKMLEAQFHCWGEQVETSNHRLATLWSLPHGCMS